MEPDVWNIYQTSGTVLRFWNLNNNCRTWKDIFASLRCNSSSPLEATIEHLLMDATTQGISLPLYITSRIKEKNSLYVLALFTHILYYILLVIYTCISLFHVYSELLNQYSLYIYHTNILEAFVPNSQYPCYKTHT